MQFYIRHAFILLPGGFVAPSLHFLGAFNQTSSTKKRNTEEINKIPRKVKNTERQFQQIRTFCGKLRIFVPLLKYASKARVLSGLGLTQGSLSRKCGNGLFSEKNWLKKFDISANLWTSQKTQNLQNSHLFPIFGVQRMKLSVASI